MGDSTVKRVNTAGLSMTIPAILLLGHSNSGKSPVGEALARTFSTSTNRLKHLDFGEHLRRTMAGSFDAGLLGDEMAYLREVMNGRLLDDDHFSIARKVILRFLSVHDLNHGGTVVLNGMPRHAGQARDVRDMGVDVRLVIVLECSPEIAWQRKCASERGQGHEDRGTRDDRGRDVFERRVASYGQETAPLISWYSDAGVAVVRAAIDVDTTPESVVELARAWVARVQLVGGAPRTL